MQVHGNNMIAPGHSKHVGYQLGSDGGTGPVFPVHASIWEARYYSGDPSGRCSLARRNENKEFHKVVIDIAGAGLDDEDIFVPYGFRYFKIDLAIGEFLDSARNKRNVEPLSHSLGELWVAIPSEDPDRIVVIHNEGYAEVEKL